MRLTKLAEAAAALGMSLTLAGVGRDPEPGIDPLCEASDLRPEALEALLALALSEAAGRPAAEGFERLGFESPLEGRGAKAELMEIQSGASATIHWAGEAGKSEIAAVEIRDAALFERLANAEALERRRQSSGARAWEEAREREALAERLGSLWAAAESKRGESPGHRVTRWSPPVELAPGAGVYGPAVFDLSSSDWATHWRLAKADNGIVRVSAVSSPLAPDGSLEKPAASAKTE